MVTPIWLTDEDADIAGYKRAKVPMPLSAPSPLQTLISTQPNKSDTPSLVRTVTPTVNGPVPSGVPVVRSVGSVTFNQGWITDPLSGPALSANTWVLHAWASQSNVLANAGLKLDVFRFSNAEGALVVSATSPALGVVVRDVALTTGAASTVQLAVGDRLVIKLSLADAGGTMSAGPVGAPYSATVAYNGLYGRAEGDTYIVCPDPLSVPNDIPDDDILAVRTILRDQGQMNPQLEDSEIIRFIRQAIQTYSVDSPRHVAYYYSGNGTQLDFPLPPKWVWGFSRIISVEYPADQQISSVEENIDWELREGVLGVQPIRFIHFRTIIPDLGANNTWILYTTRHEYSTEYTTIPVEDLDAILWLGASYCATALSSKGAGSSDSSLSGDVVNYRDMQQRWAAVSRHLKELYINRVVSPDNAAPVGFIDEWKPVLETGMNFLWHSRRVRRVR